jgi:hypothetical protein
MVLWMVKSNRLTNLVLIKSALTGNRMVINACDNLLLVARARRVSIEAVSDWKARQVSKPSLNYCVE